MPILGYNNKRKKTHLEENCVLVGSLDVEGELEAKVSVCVVFVRFVMDGDKFQCNAVKWMAWAMQTLIIVGGGVD